MVTIPTDVTDPICGRPGRKRYSDSMRQIKRDSAPRIKKRIEVRFGKDKPTYPGYSGNISRSGMMIRTTRVFGPGSRLKVEIKTPDGPFMVGARVEWARAGTIQLLQTGRVGMGVRFIDPPEDFIAWLSKREAGESKAS